MIRETIFAFCIGVALGLVFVTIASIVYVLHYGAC
jgi:hypothetical protein